MSDVIHLDTQTGLPFLPDDGTGQPRLLAMLPLSGPMALPRFGDVYPKIPKSEWQEVDLYDDFDPPILDQGQQGSCVGHGGATGFTTAWLTQGEDLVRFSPAYLYSLINGNRDQGANIADLVQALQGRGICTEATVPAGRIFRNQYDTAKADAEAANYKAIEVLATDDPDEVATAIQMRFSVADSVQVGRSFNGMDYRGVRWLAGVDNGPGNHCVHKGGMTLLPDRTWAYKGQNSWSTRWGNQGRFLTTEAHMQAQRYYQAVIFRVVSPGPKAPKRPA